MILPVNDNEESVNKEKVKVDYLSKYITRTVDFLKMDIEGAETGVMKEFAKKGKLKFVKEIVMEFHKWKDLKNNRLSELIDLLEANNFFIKLVRVLLVFLIMTGVYLYYMLIIEILIYKFE